MRASISRWRSQIWCVRWGRRSGVRQTSEQPKAKAPHDQMRERVRQKADPAYDAFTAQRLKPDLDREQVHRHPERDEWTDHLRIRLPAPAQVSHEGAQRDVRPGGTDE